MKEREMTRIPNKAIVSAEKAIDVYTRVIIGAKDIKELFGCGDAAAQIFKRAAQEYEDMHGRMKYNAHLVYTDTAYLAWGLEIDVLTAACDMRAKYGTGRKRRTQGGAK